MVNRNADVVLDEKHDIIISCSYVEHKVRGRFIKEFILTLNRPRKENEVEKPRHRKSMRKKMLKQLRLDSLEKENQLKKEIYFWVGEMRKVGFSKLNPDDGRLLTLEIYEVLQELKNS